MAVTIRSTTGTYLGDPNGIFLNEETTVDANSITINGAFSYMGQQYPLSSVFVIPFSTTSVTYISVQVDVNGSVNIYEDNAIMPVLQSGNVLVIFNEVIPQNDTPVQFTSEIEPSL